MEQKQMAKSKVGREECATPALQIAMSSFVYLVYYYYSFFYKILDTEYCLHLLFRREGNKMFTSCPTLVVQKSILITFY